MNVIEIEQLNKYFGEGENRAHILKDINVNHSTRRFCGDYRGFWFGQINTNEYYRLP